MAMSISNDRYKNDLAEMAIIPAGWLKIIQVSARQGIHIRRSGVYTIVNEHFEDVNNAVSCQLNSFQMPAKNTRPVLSARNPPA
jgi:hypothetical protein